MIDEKTWENLLEIKKGFDKGQPRINDLSSLLAGIRCTRLGEFSTHDFSFFS